MAKENIDEAVELVKDKAGALAESSRLAAAHAAEKTKKFLSKAKQHDIGKNSATDNSAGDTSDNTDSKEISIEQAKEMVKENIDEAVERVKDKAGALAESGWLVAAQAAEKTKKFLSKPELQETDEASNTTATQGDNIPEDSSSNKISAEQVKEIAKENIDEAVERAKIKAEALSKSTKKNAAQAAEKTKTFFSKVLHWFIVVLGYLTMLAFMALLAKSSLEAYQNNSAIKWEMLGASLLTFMTVNWMLYQKKTGW